jgi:hypothetical protein
LAAIVIKQVSTLLLWPDRALGIVSCRCIKMSSSSTFSPGQLRTPFNMDYKLVWSTTLWDGMGLINLCY